VTARPLCYVATPICGNVRTCAATARCWLRFLTASEPEATFIAPWLELAGGGAHAADPRRATRGRMDALAVARRCDAIVLCGGAVTAHNADEIDAVLGAGGYLVDLVFLGSVAPVDAMPGVLEHHRRRAPSIDDRAEAATIDIIQWLHRDIARRAGGVR
jgi:hypothetical protein